MTELMLDVKGLQVALGVSRDTCYQLMRSAGFPSIKLGGRYLVEKRALEEWLRRYQGKTYKLK